VWYERESKLVIDFSSLDEELQEVRGLPRVSAYRIYIWIGNSIIKFFCPYICVVM
jgi:hypothetical protein